MKNRKTLQLQEDNFEPLYTMEDVDKIYPFIKNDGSPYNQWLKVSTYVSLKFYPSGHVLGGAICVLKIRTRNKDVYFGFSGDLGRQDGIILPPPEIVQDPIDYWVIESTYGGKIHPPRENEIKKLQKIIQEAVHKKQKVIIPSFALERAQEIIYLLSYYIQTGDIPPIKIYLDSPMAVKITNIFSSHWTNGMFFDQERLHFNPFDTEENKFLHIVPDTKDSETLVNTEGPYIVIAGSGMCDAGRVRNHLRAGLKLENTVVCLVGFMTEESLGRKLKDGWPVVKMNGEEIIIKAKVHSFDSFSAHADSNFLVEYTKSIIENNYSIRNNFQQTIFINHGEKVSADSLKRELIRSFLHKENLFDRIIIPRLNEGFSIVVD